MELTAGGTSNSKSVDGVVPATYRLLGSIVSTTFQKRDESGQLTVQLLRDGRVVQSASTTAAYGVVSAAGQ